MGFPFLFFVVSLVQALFLQNDTVADQYASKKDCPFCSEKTLKAQQFYENKYARALVNYKPVTPGHILVIPKRYVEKFHELDQNEMLAIQEAIVKSHKAAQQVFGTQPYMLLQKNGAQVGQSVSHLHFHYIPRKKSQTSVAWFAVQFHTSHLQSRRSDTAMKREIHQLQQALKKLS